MKGKRSSVTSAVSTQVDLLKDLLDKEDLAFENAYDSEHDDNDNVSTGGASIHESSSTVLVRNKREAPLNGSQRPKSSPATTAEWNAAKEGKKKNISKSSFKIAIGPRKRRVKAKNDKERKQIYEQEKKRMYEKSFLACSTSIDGKVQEEEEEKEQEIEPYKHMFLCGIFNVYDDFKDIDLTKANQQSIDSGTEQNYMKKLIKSVNSGEMKVEPSLQYNKKERTSRRKKKSSFKQYSNDSSYDNYTSYDDSIDESHYSSEYSSSSEDDSSFC